MLHEDDALAIRIREAPVKRAVRRKLNLPEDLQLVFEIRIGFMVVALLLAMYQFNGFS